MIAPTPTQAARLEDRQTANSICGYYEEFDFCASHGSASRISRLTADSADYILRKEATIRAMREELPLTSVIASHPMFLVCSRRYLKLVPPHWSSAAMASAITTAMLVHTFLRQVAIVNSCAGTWVARCAEPHPLIPYSPTSQLCGRFNFESGQGVLFSCSSSSVSINVVSTRISGVPDATVPADPIIPTATTATSLTPTTHSSAASSTLPISTAPQPTPSTPNSSTDDNTGEIAGLVILCVGLLVFGALVYWFCGRKESWLRNKLRGRKYQQLGGGNVQLGMCGFPPPPSADNTPTAYNGGSQVALAAMDGASARSAPAAKWRDSDSGNRTLTYRVESIPEYVSTGVVKDLFTFVDSKRVTVRSLAPAIGSNARGLRIATVEYKSLQGKHSKGPTLSNESEQSMIHVGMKFDGWTPLNVPQSPVQADVVAVTGLAGKTGRRGSRYSS